MGGPRLTDEVRALRAETEKHYQARVMKVAKDYGWRVAHFHDSRRQVAPGKMVGDKDAAGFPDLALVHPRHGFACLELKREQGEATDGQLAWLDDLLKAGIPAAVSRPSLFEVTKSWLIRGFPKDLETLRQYR